MLIIPAILASSKQEYEELVSDLSQLKEKERVQVDFVDEAFGNLTVGVVETCPSELKPLSFDAHLMISSDDMEANVREARRVGFKRIIAQVESIANQVEYAGWIREGSGEKGQMGLAVDLETDLGRLDDRVLPELDVVLLMAVKAGRGGQTFDNRVVGKIGGLKQLRDQMGLKFRIGVDGGVEKVHLRMLEELGVDEVAVGVRRLISW